MVHFNKSKKRLLTISLIFSALFFAGCWNSSQDPELTVINVLDKEDYDDCHIKGSVNIFWDDIADKLLTLDKSKQYVVYCSDQACSTSTYNAKMFLDAGFQNIWDYEDGMSGWYQAGLPYEGPAEKTYLKNKGMNFGDEASDTLTITTQDLFDKMKEFGLL
jgi:rhodanese-related sulfurtransferase